jgi:hypothetical protein
MTAIMRGHQSAMHNLAAYYKNKNQNKYILLLFIFSLIKLKKNGICG